MEPFGNIDKRIKRHVLGKSQSFYVSALPGFEQLCLDGISGLGIACEDAQISKGGIEFSGHIHECYLANLHLRVANRIMMRIDSFRATNFRQLVEKTSTIPWELYLKPDSVITVSAASKHSRLIHTGAIVEKIHEGIDKRRRAFHSVNDQPTDSDRFFQQIFIRAQDDRFTVSIDSSGELLHKRGLKIHSGKAPLRETIAAAILAVAGYDPTKPLIDPMCGAGTFSLEAAMIANHIPAGWYREFAFMGWPCFKEARWKYIRKEAEKLIKQTNNPVIFASDKNPTACKKLETVVDQYDLSQTVSVIEKDFFDLLPSGINQLHHGGEKGLVVINPPYGRRLETKASSKRLFEEICAKLKKDFRGWNVALIAPDKKLAGKAPFKPAKVELFHGGLKLMLMIGKVG